MIKRLLNKSDFLKNVATLITGTVLAQLIPILLQPILSRIYDAAEYGTFTIYISIIGMLAAAGNLKFEGAVVLPDSDKKGSALVIGGIIISFFFSALWFIIFLLFGEQIIEIFHFSSSIKIWLLIIPFAIFVISSSRVLNYWLIRQKAFKASSVNKLARRASEGTSQFAILKFSNQQGLIIGNIIGETINFFISLKQSFNKNLSFKGITYSEVKEQLNRYKDFPLYSFLPSLMNSISLFLPAIVINHFYAIETTGQFGFSRQILSIPIALISLSLSQVLIQKIAESNRNKNKILPLIFKITSVLTGLAIIGILIIEFFGIEIFTWVFGIEWKTAGQLTQILIFSYAIKFIVSPLTSVFTALEKIKISSIWQIGYFLAIGCLYLLKNCTIEEFLLYYVLIDLISYFIYYLLLVGVCKKYDNKILR